MQVSPYLFFNGNCQEAFEYYQQLLGSEILAMLPHTGSPAAEQVPADFQEKIMHACMKIGDTMLMASDCPPDFVEKPQGFKVSLAVHDPAEAERIYDGLQEGAEIQMPLQETFWAQRFAMLIDRFGTPWMINCGKPTE
ncbi:VOC family protein [Blastopirellula marina]|uniref:VOC family protein n=1 Tax=Blastopirellula marina TaxID=124 RepID=A0A2S8GS45_9BACT|nr:glyoxalase/bleomycin resistance/extradiol dioxygenase family protein [Blastopirellula marina]PQO47232.1 VOC family protein [Blastopirellula marina]